MRFKLFSLITLSVLVILTAGITSCGKSGGGSVNGITATVGSSGFTPATSVAFFSQSGAFWEIGGYTIKSGDTTALVVSLSDPVTLNTKLNNSTAAIGIEYYISGSKDYVAGPGWGTAYVTVTSLDSTGHKIAGTFSGTLYNSANSNDSIKVTNGQFNSAYIIE